MATLALGALGAAAGSALLPAGLSILGTTLTGAAIGSQIGAMAGSLIDQALLGNSGARASEGPRLADLHVTTSTEGAPIPRLFGRARLGGQIIWATSLEEEIVTTDAGGGGKGMSLSPSATSTEYRYYANFAVGLCEGEIASLGRVWADGREISLANFTTRLYRGTETQNADALIEAKEGAFNAPAYRGLAYIVFDRLPLAEFGNRIPQLSFEVARAVDDLTERIRGAVMIPGSGEFVYDTAEIQQRVGMITLRPENLHTSQGGTDWTVSLDQLQATLPNATSVSLVVSWFGTSLNAADCDLKPGVDSRAKITRPRDWTVAGENRANAHLVSQIDNRPAYGGTPDDLSVVAAITDLKARGLKAVLSPFILMDIPPGNTFGDPYSTAAEQSAYPWRGRITVSPAPGQAGSPDKTSAATTALANFIGTATVADFSITGPTVTYSGPAEWSFRRMILHYAHLAKAAGGVDTFVICSELSGLTQLRSAPHVYPFVTALIQLADDVRDILGPSTKITYAADWSEYFGHQPQDASGDVAFHLDPLWASPNIDAIGIDCYWPLSDWRDGNDNLDAAAGHPAITDIGYLVSNIAGGEGYDWYYASAADRRDQIRTPITDGSGKPWTFRYKDIRNWWLNPHFNRTAGVESATPTAWLPQSKPVWFMELGCPAVDKGSNQPNVFIDAKSTESALPHFSNGTRDDTIQRRYLEAFHAAFDPAHPHAIPGLNPESQIYGGHMVDIARIHVYAWDARPSPVFPALTSVWGDAENWRLGHWLSGRMSGASLQEVVSAILAGYGFSEFDASELTGIVPGFVIDRIMSARDALKPLELAYFFDSIESGGKIRFRHRRQQAPVQTITPDDSVEVRSSQPLLRLTRGQETELPAIVKVGYLESGGDYAQRVAETSRSTVASQRVASAALPLVLDPEHAAQIAATWLHETWSGRDRAHFVLPPKFLALESGDVVALTHDGRTSPYRVISIGDSGPREIEARRIETLVYDVAPQPSRTPVVTPPPPVGPPLAALLDLPTLRDGEPSYAGYAAAVQDPWPGAIALWRSPDLAGYQLKGLLPIPATTGTVVSATGSSHPWRLDYGSDLVIDLDRGLLTSVTRSQLLSGANRAALEVTPRNYEIIQFEAAELISPNRYRLKTLLRGQLGTEAISGPILPGARFILLDSAVRPVSTAIDDLDRAFNWKIGPASRDIGDATYITSAHTFEGRGLRPLSPVHIRAIRTPAGDLVISWLRRTRIGGDSWETYEVPLGEDNESYALDILDGITVKRTLTVSAPTATYLASQQLADFGALQSTVSISVAQVSASRGRGTAAAAIL